MDHSVNPRSAKSTRQVEAKRIEPRQDFLLRVTFECRRAERSGRRFLLVLIDGVDSLRQDILPALQMAHVTRDIDTLGWYREGTTLGILYPELGGSEAAKARDVIVAKVQTAIQSVVDSNTVAISAHILPHDLNEGETLTDALEPIYERLDTPLSRGKKLQLKIKRVIDLVGSVLLLIGFAPLMAIVAIAVKRDSPGPVLYRQTRVGQGGKQFVFLKFRSMKVDNNPSVHEKYVKEFIRGTAVKNPTGNGEEVFKLTQDSRVTSLGRFLRKTSLDELPQFWNVLRGDMSLVGPRPPIPYELECYDLWHQRRILEMKPGITGLWQVWGRSRTGFDDMVRLDLQYALTWSPWLDMKILLHTPRAVFGDGGAH